MQKYHPWEALERYSRHTDLMVRHSRAQEMALKAAFILKAKYRARRVKLFGSLARQARFTPRSDLDLYVEDIPADVFFKAEAEVELLAEPEFKVDLVDSRECTPELKRRIDEEGVDL